MEFVYRTKGTCSQAIKVVLSPDDTIEEVVFAGGCAGNLMGISSLVKGKNANEVIESLSGTKCGNKPTSCPDQLAVALREALSNKA